MDYNSLRWRWWFQQGFSVLLTLLRLTSQDPRIVGGRGGGGSIWPPPHLFPFYNRYIQHIKHDWKALVHAIQNMAKNNFLLKIMCTFFVTHKKIWFLKIIFFTGLFVILNFCKHVDAKTLQIWAILGKKKNLCFFWSQAFQKVISHSNWMTGSQCNRLLQKPCKSEQAVHTNLVILFIFILQDF